MANYKGGKNGSGVAQTIINEIPPHDVYVECFLGSGAILMNKKPAPVANMGVEIDPDVVERWMREGYDHIVVQGDAVEFLTTWRDHWKTERVFVYLDPPYLQYTRRSKNRLYRFEFWTSEDHARLLKAIQQLPDNWMVAISGYDNTLYNKTLVGWRRLDFEAWTRVGKALESLWMNYPKPFELHDHRFVGKGYRERERIKKKKMRWVRMLKEMDDQERFAVMDAISQARTEWDTIQKRSRHDYHTRNEG